MKKQAIKDMKNKTIEFEKGFHPNDIPSFVM